MLHEQKPFLSKKCSISPQTYGIYSRFCNPFGPHQKLSELTLMGITNSSLEFILLNLMGFKQSSFACGVFLLRQQAHKVSKNRSYG